MKTKENIEADGYDNYFFVALDLCNESTSLEALPRRNIGLIVVPPAAAATPLSLYRWTANADPVVRPASPPASARFEELVGAPRWRRALTCRSCSALETGRGEPPETVSKPLTLLHHDHSGIVADMTVFKLFFWGLNLHLKRGRYRR